MHKKNIIEEEPKKKDIKDFVPTKLSDNYGIQLRIFYML